MRYMIQWWGQKAKGGYFNGSHNRDAAISYARTINDDRFYKRVTVIDEKEQKVVYDSNHV